jgi:alkanesulfonate monooxygenase SsuD/methylene tetrahydromethanopterin reductase-like flavin-dependent oxidoreductase (luciferase family)
VGTPKTVVERLRAYEEIGACRVYLLIYNASETQQLNLVADDVMPFLE